MQQQPPWQSQPQQPDWQSQQQQPQQQWQSQPQQDWQSQQQQPQQQWQSQPQQQWPSQPQPGYQQPGYQQPVYQQPVMVAGVMVGQQKDWLTALLLCIFLGTLGVHRFYVGKSGSGIAMLLTAGGCWIWWIVDVVSIASGSFRDSNGLPLLKK